MRNNKKIRKGYGSILVLLGAALFSSSALSQSKEELDDYRYQASQRMDCPAYEGESQEECRARLKRSGANKNSDWSPYDNDEDRGAGGYSGNQPFEINYNGQSGWETYSDKSDKKQNRNYENNARFEGQCLNGESQSECSDRLNSSYGEKGNKNYRNDAKYYGDCQEGESNEECEGKLGGNKNYDNDSQYYGNCRSGESEEDCQSRLGQNKNYQNDARYYGQCGAGESDEECESRLRQNQNYDNNARYYGECGAGVPEEECNSGSGKNQNYKLDMSDFSGNGDNQNTYSGIPSSNRNSGNGMNMSDFNGSGRDSSNSNKDWSKNGSDYNGNRVDGSFAGYGDGAQGDWETLKNKQMEYQDDVDLGLNADDLKKADGKKNPLLTLIFCHLQIPFEGPRAVYKDKECRRAVKDLCSFKVSRMKVSGPSQCLGFAPWNM